MTAMLVLAACLCGEAPERANDFFWENELVGFRAYGPGEKRPWSGFDLFHKFPGAVSVGALLHGTLKPAVNWHETPCSGLLDNYTIGPGRGIGGVAVCVDGKWQQYPVWESHRVIRADDTAAEFELVYPAFSPAGKMTCHITLKRGEQFFRNDVSFERTPPADMLAGPGLDVSHARGHEGALGEDAAALTLVEKAKGTNGSTMTAIFVSDPSLVTAVTDSEGCRVFAFRGQRQFTYWAGADWSKAGRCKKASDWHNVVREFQDRLVPDCPVSPAAMKPLAPHPRLFAEGKDFAALKRKLETTELGRMGKARLLYEADAILSLPLLERKQEGRRLLAVSRAALDRIGKLAMAYRVTGKGQYARRAIDEATNVARFTDWNPSHFLDVGEMTLAVALARDWLDDVLTPEEKAFLSRAIREKGLLDDATHLKNGWWVRTDCNWNQVCHGGLLAGALAVYEDDPRVAEAIVRRARRCLPNALAPYAGGNFPEGPACYWEYATDFTALSLDSLLRSYAGAEELLETEGLAAHVDYLDLMTGSTGAFFNYSDAGSENIVLRRMIAASWYLARTYGRPDALLAHEVGYFRDYASKREPIKTTYRSNSRLLPFVLLWLPENIDSSATSRAPLCCALGGMNPVGVLRSGFGQDDWYVGIKGGTARANHSHLDVGSFVLDAGGIRWATDLGCENYNRIEQMKTISLWDRTQDSSRWSLFRLGVEGHGTLIIDDCNQMLAGCGTVTVDGSRAVVDMSSVCSNAQSVVRTFMLGDGNLRIMDALSGLKAGSRVTWNMNTAASANAEGNVLTLTARTRDGARRMMRLVAADSLVWEVESLEKPKTSADSPNPGLTRIRLTQRAKPDGKLAFDVTFELSKEVQK